MRKWEMRKDGRIRSIQRGRLRKVDEDKDGCGANGGCTGMGYENKIIPWTHFPLPVATQLIAPVMFLGLTLPSRKKKCLSVAKGIMMQSRPGTTPMLLLASRQC